MARFRQPELPFSDQPDLDRDVECNMATKTKRGLHRNMPAGLAAIDVPFTHFCEGSGIIVGDSRESLGRFPDATFQSCITSPPYWGLRDYGIANQIGAEMELDQYIDHIAAVIAHGGIPTRRTPLEA